MRRACACVVRASCVRRVAPTSPAPPLTRVPRSQGVWRAAGGAQTAGGNLNGRAVGAAHAIAMCCVFVRRCFCVQGGRRWRTSGGAPGGAAGAITRPQGRGEVARRSGGSADADLHSGGARVTPSGDGAGAPGAGDGSRCVAQPPFCAKLTPHAPLFPFLGVSGPPIALRERRFVLFSCRCVCCPVMFLHLSKQACVRVCAASSLAGALRGSI